MMNRLSFSVLLAVCFVNPAVADVRPSTMFGDGMVLQRDMPVPVWGLAAPSEEVVVEFGNQQKSTVAGDDGKWIVRLDKLAASDRGRTLTIRGDNTVAYEDVLVGEVWICCGQSNMVMGW